MYDIVNCEAKEKHGFTNLILFSKLNKIKEIKEEKELLNNINFKGIFLLKNFRISSEMIKVIGEKGKGIFLIDFSQLYHSRGVKRGILLSQLRDFFKFCLKYKAKFCFMSFANKEEEIRTVEEIIGIGSLIGLNEGQVKFGLNELKNHL